MKARFTYRRFINLAAVRKAVVGIAALALPSCAGMPEDAAEEQSPGTTRQTVAATVTITDDATVRQDAPDTNFGAETEIVSDNGTGVTAEMFIKFSVSNIPAGATVSNAQLKLTCFNGTDNGPGLRLASNTSPTNWTEGTVTWNTRPASISTADLDNVGAVTASATSPAIVTWNITSGVTGNGVYTLRLAQNSSDGLGCASRQHATASYRPVVTVDYTTGSGAATVSVTDDATVREDAPSTNFGAETEIVSDNGTGVKAEMFIKLSVSNIPAGATVSSAQLKLTCFNGTDNGPGLTLASNTSPTNWTEGTVTWNTRPATLSTTDLDNVGAVTASATSPAIVTWNITSGVTGNGVYTLRLAQNGTNALGCASRQHATAAYRPVVTVNYTTGPQSSGELRWFWYGASAQGTGDGSSHANRKAYTSLAADMNGAGVQPGDAFLLAASDTYPVITSAINITPNAGTSANRVVLRGANADRTAAYVTLKSNRSDPYVAPRNGGVSGTTLFNLGSATKPVNYFKISHINFEAVGRAMQVLGGARNLLVTDIRFRNIRILLRAENNAYLRNSTLQNVVGYGYSKELIDLGRNSSGSNYSEFVTIDNVFADSQWQDGDEIPAGVAIHGDTWVDDAKTIAGAGNRNILIKNSTFKNLKFSPLPTDSDQYYQGDGISTEERDFNITIDNVTVDGAGDAGMDMKACESLIKNSTVMNAKRSVRKHPGVCPTGISDTLNVENLKSRNPLQPGGSGREAHIWATHGADVVYNANANGAGEFYTNRAPTGSTAACFLTENDGISGTSITVNAGAVTKPSAFNLTYGDGTETIGPAVTVTNL